MQASTLFTFHSLFCDEITHIDHVAQFAQLAGSLATLEQPFGFFIEDVQSVPCTYQPGITADNTNVCFHDLVNFLHTLGNQYTFFIGDGSFVVPFGDIFVKVITFQYTERMFGGSVGIYNRFYQRVGSQTVASVQTCAGAFS